MVPRRVANNRHWIRTNYPELTTARVYVPGDNLYTRTRYTGSVPEISINGNAIDPGGDHNTIVNASVNSPAVNIGF